MLEGKTLTNKDSEGIGKFFSQLILWQTILTGILYAPQKLEGGTETNCNQLFPVATSKYSLVWVFPPSFTLFISPFLLPGMTSQITA